MATAYVLINCKIGSENLVINNLNKMEGVKKVNGVFGAYDIIVDVDTPSIDKLREIISLKIRNLDGVRNTITLMAIKY